MGSRGRSIRLRIYVLVTIPLVTMLGLFAYVAISSITNYNNLNRAPNLIRSTSEQATKFVNFIQQERRDAMVYLSSPNAANLAEFEADASQTKTGAVAFDQAMTSPQTESVENSQEAADIAKMISDVNGLSKVRLGVEGDKISAIQAFEAYTDVIMNTPVIFQAEADSLTNGSAVSSGLGLISAVNEHEDVGEQDAMLAGALASGVLTPQERVIFDEAAGRQQDDTTLADKLLNPTELAAFNAQMQQPDVLQAESFISQAQQAVESGASIKEIEALGITSQSWFGYTSTWSSSNYLGGLDAADQVLNADEALANTAKDEVILFGSIGAAGLILTLIISILLGQSVNRRLKILRTSAATLATEQLPNVVARLRRGDTVDVAAEAPPLQVGSDEIGQVGEAIDLVRQTALRSAVEESRLRQGVNDMFRNLARRNQSLLQRQLGVLDSMERRATDPDVLDDLFKMDHLTTRMRRHAEGLIILSGAVPGRSWSNPVKLVDVMRGAVAEVEDFARVTVTTQSKAMLSGNAVTDVIHLLAELIENATSLSPPFTQVRVSGESVSNGFAIEIEDRGLGLTPARMTELNERLANPPDVNPANTEQLGLFVVGQLARRHGITVMLRPSPYGGTTAVTLIPTRLVVDDNTPTRNAGPVAIGAGPGIPTPALPTPLAAGPLSPSPLSPTPLPPGPVPMNTAAAGNGYRPDNDYPGTEAPGDGPFPRRKSPKRVPGASLRSANAPFTGTPMPADASSADTSLPADASMAPGISFPDGASLAAGTPAAPGMPTPIIGVRPTPGPPVRSTPPDLDKIPLTSPFAPRSTPLTSRPAAAQRQPGSAQEQPGTARPQPGTAHPGAVQSGGDIPVVTGVPVSRSTRQSPDYFTRPADYGDTGTGVGGNRTRASNGPTYDTGGSGYNTGNSPYNSGNSTYGNGSDGYGTGTPAPGNGSSITAPVSGNNSGTEGLGNGGSGSVGGETNGLPKRVRQANLAPQLRSSRAAGGKGSAPVPPAAPPNPADVRSTLSAMQRGWKQGRSQQNRDTEGNK
jgi:signal transduction histidine kinase